MKIRQKGLELREKWPTWAVWSRNFGILAVVAIAIAIPVLSTVKHQVQALPQSLSLAVPFTTQAPDGNWIGNEDCEEASLVMANAYLTGNTSDTLPASAAVAAMSLLVGWENSNLGHNANSGASDIAKMAGAADSLKADVVSGYTEDQLKQALKAGQVILLTVNASKLGNPNYSQPPPTYHVIVIRGYDGDTFYANDPGIDNGKNYPYTFATLQAAGADWDSASNSILDGQGKAIILSKS